MTMLRGVLGTMGLRARKADSIERARSPTSPPRRLLTGATAGRERPQPLHGQVLALQRRVGNRAVGKVLSTASGARDRAWALPGRPLVTVQRFESPEHQDLGDQHLDTTHEWLQTDVGRAWARQHGLPASLVEDIAADEFRRGRKFRTDNGVELSPGDVIALMGDLYPTWQAIMHAPRKQLEGHLETMRGQRMGTISGEEAEGRYQEVSEGRYLELAERNDEHFAPDNRPAWRRLHEEALEKARRAGGDRAALDEALFIDAAGGHFLTDAFAAGHSFDKHKVLAAIGTHLQSHPVNAGNPELQLYVAAAQAAGKLSHLVLKNVHDHFNVAGLPVRNGLGMSWRTYGDSALGRPASEETRRIGSLAVFASRQQVMEASRGGTPNPDDVLAYLPNAKSVEDGTRAAIEYIPQAAADVPNLVIGNAGISRVLLGNYVGRWVEAHLSGLGMRRGSGIDGAVERIFNDRAHRNIIIPDSSSGVLRIAPLTLNVRDFLSDRQVGGVSVPNINFTAPIPGVEGLSGELDVAGHDLTVGVHLDVGRFLPESLGFGPALPTRLGDRVR